MIPRVLAFKNTQDIVREFRRIGVDAGGIRIMRGKAFERAVKVGQIPSFCANILKQEMLSLGGDAALSRGSITGADKKTECLLLGNLSQYSQLIKKLKEQPFGLALLAGRIGACLSAFDRPASLRIGDRHLYFGRRTHVMGIINVTRDSFSGDGILGLGAADALARAQALVREGADFIDVGGESTRPGARGISAKEEMARVLPLIKSFKRSLRAPFSIDTTKADVAQAALDCGAALVNDVSALRDDSRMAKLIARSGAGVILMHRKGLPRTMQVRPRYDDLISEIYVFLRDAVKKALDSGIREDKIIVDPGIGFGKTLDHNLEILRRLLEFRSLGRPVLVGVSRKWFIGRLLGADVSQRAWGTAGAVAAAVANGADIVRVHDVGEVKQVVRVADAVHKRATR
ncbi:MAG: dihydropteroate synthase [Candidatus Omnitrophota bacterium]